MIKQANTNKQGHVTLRTEKKKKLVIDVSKDVAFQPAV